MHRVSTLLCLSIVPWLSNLPAGGPLSVERRAAHIRQTVQRVPLTVDSDTFLPQPLVPGTLEPVIPPDHGSLAVVGEGSFMYSAEPLYMGYDRAIFQAEHAVNRETVLLELEIRVLPAALPVAGIFEEGGHGAFGLYYTFGGTFELCDPWPGPDNVLKCKEHAVAGAAPGWLPVSGDLQGVGWGLPSLFDPTTGTLHRLKAQAGSATLQIASSKTYGEAAWMWPVAGDWQGRGVDDLALVDSTGHVHQLEIHPFGYQLVAWEEPVPVPTDGSIPWPTIWPLDPVPDRDSLAILHEGVDALHWLVHDGTAWHKDYQTVSRGEDRVPFRAVVAGLDSTSTLLFFRLWPAADGLLYRIEHWADGHPSTLPLKFPHEPPDI